MVIPKSNLTSQQAVPEKVWVAQAERMWPDWLATAQTEWNEPRPEEARQAMLTPVTGQVFLDGFNTARSRGNWERKVNARKCSGSSAFTARGT